MPDFSSGVPAGIALSPLNVYVEGLLAYLVRIGLAEECDGGFVLRVPLLIEPGTVRP